MKKGVSHKDTSVGKRKHLDNFFVQLEKTLILKRVEFIENGKSVLFLGDYITKSKDKGYVCGQHAHDAGHGELQTNKHTDGAKGVCGKRRPRNAGRLR